MGSYRTFFDVSYDRSGHRYYADRYGYLGETVETTRNYARKQEIFSEVYSYLAENDPIAPEMPYTYPYIFLESDFFNLLEIPLETP